METMEIVDDKKNTVSAGPDIFKWDDSSTRLLLTLYKDAIRDFGKVSHLKTKHQVWVHVIEELSKYGYFVNPKQAQNRLVTLERSYKKRQSELVKSHHNSITSLFDDEIKEIMDKRINSSFGRSELSELFTENSNFIEDTEYVNIDPSNSEDNCMSAYAQPVIDLSRWDPDSTKIFITAYLSLVKNPSKMRKFKSKGKMWQHITSQINSRGYDFTPRQTQNRYGTLIRAYKKYLEKKRCGVRSFFLFEAEVREILKHRFVVPDPARQSDWEDDDDDDEPDANEDIDVRFISVEEASIDNIAIDSEPENSQSEFPQSNACQSVPSSYSTENYAILNELRLLRKSESQYQQKIAKIEEEKLDLMRQNNILLKVLIEKLSKS